MSFVVFPCCCCCCCESSLGTWIDSTLLTVLFDDTQTHIYAHRVPSSNPGRYQRTFRHQTKKGARDDNINNNNQDIQTISTKKDKREMLEFIESPMTSTVGDNAFATTTTTTSIEESLKPLVECIVKAADGRKAEDIVALQVHHVSTLTSVLILVSGNSRPQNQAIAAAITRDVQETLGERPGGNGVPEGSAESGWILLDYGSVMVHIMTPKSRLFYNVEGQWKDKGGIPMDIDYLLVPNQVVGINKSDNNKLEPVAEEDPFWS